MGLTGMPMFVEQLTAKLYDDEAVRKKLEVMSKWEAMFDDGRNPETDLEGKVEAFLKPGKRYFITLTIVEIPDE